MSGYKGGRITRIKIKGFMTYDDLELEPKGGLNLIMGLNGSGKSSIMSAICLGLAGKPQFTGKSAQVSDFIKMGHTKASIQIELEDPGRKSIVITRHIVGEKSTWLLNNTPTNNSEVMAVVKKFNIDISNLCQFLPQEKVAEFSKMDKKQRLENMLKAIGDQKLVSLFDELKQLTVDCEALAKNLQNLYNNKQTEEQKNEHLQSEVQKQDDRMVLENKLKDANQRKMVLKYQDHKEKIDLIKIKQKEIRVKKVRIEGEMNELQENKQKAINECKRKMSTIQENEKEINLLTENIGKLTTYMADIHEKVERAKIEFKNRIEEKNNQKAKLSELSLQIKALNELKDKNKEIQKEMQNRAELNKQEYEYVREQLLSLDPELQRAVLDKNQYEYQLKGILHEISQIQNEGDKKMELLRQRFRHTYDAVQWLQQNRDSFKGNICLPAILTIKVHDENNRKYIENHVSIRDLLTFVCEDKEDVLRLTTILTRQMKLSVNIALAPTSRISDYASPPITPNFRRLGILSFMSNLFTAPEPMMCYLCDLFKLHTIPICSMNAEENMEAIMDQFPRFYTPTEKFSGSRSKYGNRNLSVRRDQIVGKNILLNARDYSKQLEDKENNKRMVEEKLDDLKEKTEAFKAQYNALEKKQEVLREERSKLAEKMKGMDSVHVQLKQKSEMYTRKEREVVDEAKEKRKMTMQIASLNAEQLRALSKLPSHFRKIKTLKEEKVKVSITTSVISNRLSELDDITKEKESEFQSIAEQMTEINTEKQRLKTIAQGYWNTLQRINSVDLQVLLSHLGNIEDVEQEIVNIQAKLELNSEANHEVVLEYQRRQALIQNVGKNIQQVEEEMERLRKERTIKKNEWMPALEFHISNINTKFSKHYKSLQCAGEISLDKTDNPDDFPKYGLQIRLKYRVDEDFQELSQTHHSGGECSVAAIIFILSLQDLTEVPFRCIDEINQGMDSVNERKIYELIAEASRGGSCSQYFLLTPKLLMDLSFHQDVAVHIIYNSQFLTTKMDLKKHLKIAARN